MRKIASCVSLVTVVVFAYVCLISTSLYAQPKGPGTPYPYRPYDMPASTPFSYRYDVETVKTISGTIKGISTVPTTGYALVTVTVETAKKEKYTVNLGPIWYFIRQGFGIKEGDKVEVTGSDIGVGNKNMLLAAKVVRGDSILELRDSNGIPYWASSRGR